MNSRTFVIADTHFNDANIIRFCHRPFSSVADMNSALIDNWNSVVEPCDTVWILGDFFKFESLCDYPADEFGRDVKDILHKLHGHKNLIKGNHDIKSDSFYTHHFDFYSHYPILLNSFFYFHTSRYSYQRRHLTLIFMGTCITIQNIKTIRHHAV
jgi:calcineurin-like phosphoesterase family protein